MSNVPDIPLIEINDNNSYNVNEINLNLMNVDEYYNSIMGGNSLSDIDVFYSKIYTEDEFIEYMKDKDISSINNKYFDIYLSKSIDDNEFTDVIKINNDIDVYILNKDNPEILSLYRRMLIKRDRVHRLLFNGTDFIKINNKYDLSEDVSTYRAHSIPKNNVTEIQPTISLADSTPKSYYKSILKAGINLVDFFPLGSYEKDINIYIKGDDNFYFHSDKTIYCFNISKNKIIWKRKFNEYIIAGTLRNSEYHAIESIVLLGSTNIYLLSINGAMIRARKHGKRYSYNSYNKTYCDNDNITFLFNNIVNSGEEYESTFVKLSCTISDRDDLIGIRFNEHVTSNNTVSNQRYHILNNSSNSIYTYEYIDGNNNLVYSNSGSIGSLSTRGNITFRVTPVKFDNHNAATLLSDGINNKPVILYTEDIRSSTLYTLNNNLDLVLDNIDFTIVGINGMTIFYNAFTLSKGLDKLVVCSNSNIILFMDLSGNITVVENFNKSTIHRVYKLDNSNAIIILKNGDIVIFSPFSTNTYQISGV